MLILARDEVTSAVTMREAIDAVEKAYSHYYQAKAKLPLRTRIHCEAVQGDMLFMPAYMTELGGLGIKIVSVFPENLKNNKPTISAVILYSDAETGEPLCLMDAAFLTALRTGAAAGVAVRHLANPKVRKAALFGTGGQALQQLEAILEERKVEEILVFDLDPDRADNFIELSQKQLSRYDFQIKRAKDPNEAVADAGIVTAVTTSKKPVFSGKILQPGTHVNGIGSFTPEMQEIDEVVLAKADKIVIDSYEASFKEAGDLIIPLEKGLINRESIYCEIGEITSGEKPGREKETEITYFKSVGIAAQDIAVAKIVYENARLKGLGKEINLF